MRKLVWFLVVVIVLLVVADRIADYAAERVVADKFRSSQRLDKNPDVAITGFPFLTQFASGHYDHVTAKASDLRVGTLNMRLSVVRLDFRDVTASRNFRRFEAGSATASATLSYGELSRVLGATVGYAGDGRVRATKTITVLGNQVSPTISVKPELVNAALAFSGYRIDLRDLPPNVRSQLRNIFDTRLGLSGIPFDVQVTAIRADRQGIELRLSGTHLVYSAGR